MKRIIVFGIFLISTAGEVAADCSSRPVSPLQRFLINRTACATKDNGDKWQEFHQAGGALIDYKRGPNDPVDPTKQVGTWLVGPSSRVCYDYGSGGKYCYTVHSIGNAKYEFCPEGQTTPDVVVNFVGGNVGCGFN